MNIWNDASLKVPKPFEDVLTFSVKDGVCIGFHTGNQWVVGASYPPDAKDYMAPTHRMHFPKPPET